MFGYEREVVGRYRVVAEVGAITAELGKDGVGGAVIGGLEGNLDWGGDFLAVTAELVFPRVNGVPADAGPELHGTMRRRVVAEAGFDTCTPPELAISCGGKAPFNAPKDALNRAPCLSSTTLRLKDPSRPLCSKVVSAARPRARRK